MINAVLLTLYVLVIATIDLRSHRIPNTVTLAALIASLGVAIVSSGGSGALGWIGGLTVGLMIFLPFHLLRAFGAGDVKAMAAVGSFLGVKGALIAASATLIAGGIIGACVLFATAASLRHGMYRLVGVFSAPLLPVQPPGKSVQRFPYGIAIAVGAIFTVIVAMPDLELTASAAP